MHVCDPCALISLGFPVQLFGLKVLFLLTALHPGCKTDLAQTAIVPLFTCITRMCASSEVYTSCHQLRVLSLHGSVFFVQQNWLTEDSSLLLCEVSAYRLYLILIM